jgi:hypothetical protein
MHTVAAATLRDISTALVDIDGRERLQYALAQERIEGGTGLDGSVNRPFGHRDFEVDLAAAPGCALVQRRERGGDQRTNPRRVEASRMADLDRRRGGVNLETAGLR